ncbi:glycosyltransferase family 4 protein [Patescibacteria group bacterium]|nr:glycosyltransferase family 4 protein [Patescibacteria group bacterium]MBU1702932.1 glycosyltransferase family 4 protein [Patescibacteria group bacterium]MBU1953478.1 glycosyltransferase family 4 protein [Patescibacteria group bacterium]
MVIAIDLRPLLGGKTSGVEMYITHLLKNLLKVDHRNRYVFFLNSTHNESSLIKSVIKIISENPSSEKHLIVHTKYPNKIFNLLLIFLRYPRLDRLIYRQTGLQPDIFFAPDLRPAPISSKTIKITTIHDLAFKHFPKFFSLKSRIWFKMLNAAREIHESTKIIAVSNFTKKDIVKTYSINPAKIIVIHEGVEPNFSDQIEQGKIAEIKAKYKLPDNFFLFLSTIEPRKNIPNLIKGFKIFIEKFPKYKDYQLVIAGKTNHKIFSKIHSQNNPNIHFPGFISQKDKATLYSMASAFIYPSILEGFGLPLLEAMRCGVPIISSNTSSIPEVTGKAAILINPLKPDEIAAAMNKTLILKNRRKLQLSMKKQVTKFSWEKCAKETLTTFSLSLQNPE